tara:strand:- start:230 stop:400 length:171 start_codon:yes stop_codon:yes gene_type:complete
VVDADTVVTDVRGVATESKESTQKKKVGKKQSKIPYNFFHKIHFRARLSDDFPTFR